ncbi:MAG: hypothetical protein IPM86_07700 [Saprospiraceae bacterium]|nr:hypothetical protein [Saprospiraceae bacterium]
MKKIILTIILSIGGIGAGVQAQIKKFKDRKVILQLTCYPLREYSSNAVN